METQGTGYFEHETASAFVTELGQAADPVALLLQVFQDARNASSMDENTGRKLVAAAAYVDHLVNGTVPDGSQPLPPLAIDAAQTGRLRYAAEKNLPLVLQHSDLYAYWQERETGFHQWKKGIDELYARLVFIENDVQDRNSEAWKKLCDYIDRLAESGDDEFSPAEALGRDLFDQIYTLPESIAKLKKVKKIWLYGSRLKRIPPEIGQMEALEYFDPYTSYDLHWLPYEITRCKNLKDSRISTRTLYGNQKNRMPFPSLTHNPVRYTGQNLHCSVCQRPITYGETRQLWITLWIGTDFVPLLVNACSPACIKQLPAPPAGFIGHAHKGGPRQEQPGTEEWEKAHSRTYTIEEFEALLKTQDQEKAAGKKPGLLRLVRKIWERGNNE